MYTFFDVLLCLREYRNGDSLLCTHERARPHAQHLKLLLDVQMNVEHFRLFYTYIFFLFLVPVQCKEFQ